MLYQTSTEIIKGTDNQIFIAVKDHDRKPVALVGQHVVAYLINVTQDKTYFIGNLQINDLPTGRSQLTFRKRDIAKIPVGHYRLILVVRNCEQEIESLDNIENLLFTGEDYRPIMDLRVVDGVFERLKKSHQVTTFNIIDGWETSDVIDITKLPDREGNNVTVSLTLQRFLGDVIVQGCYSETPSNDHFDWVTLEHKQYSIDLELNPRLESEIMRKSAFGIKWQELDPNEHTFGFTFEANCRWIRIVYRTYIDTLWSVERHSAVTKVLLRS